MPSTHGCVQLVAARSSFTPLIRHIERRCLAQRRRVVAVLAGPHEEPVAALLRQLDRPAPAIAPEQAAAWIARACSDAVLLIPGGAQGRWGVLVREALREHGQRDGGLLLIELSVPLAEDAATNLAALRMASSRGVALSVPSPTSGQALDCKIQLDRLNAEDRRAWWSAVAAEAEQLREGEQDLSRLDSWWQRAANLPSAEAAAPALSARARRLWAALAHAGTRLSLDLARALSDDAAVEALLETGVARLADQQLLLSEPYAAHTPPGAPSASLLRQIAAGLAEQADDPAAWMRAAEIAADAGDGAGAEALALRALSASHERTSRQDSWFRYAALLDRLDDEGALPRLLRSAEHALMLGDGERAEELTRRALVMDSQAFDVLFAHGRAAQLRGDLTAAALSLTRAIAAAQDDAARAKAAALMAQVRLVAGDDAQAQRFAEQAVSLAQDERTRLDGRNVLGKLLLGRDEWTPAEEHFATDAYDAAIATEREAELRARLNRALAVLSLGRRHQARDLLEGVLADGQQHNLPQAVAFALSNLATVAILQHRFADALVLSERAIEIRTQLGIRHGLVQPITNLAELRLMLGLVDEAEDSLRFGLKSCGTSLPASLFAYFAKTMARVHLARGDGARAQRSLATALSSVAVTGDVSLPGQCHRIAARIALGDGDVARARASLIRAQGCRQSGFGVADVIVIEAQVMRASGEAYADVAARAFSVGEQTGNIEAMLEACVLLAQSALAGGDHDSGRAHLDHALEIRQAVVDALPESLRERYQSRIELNALNELAAGQLRVARRGVAAEPSNTRAVSRITPRVRHAKPTLLGNSRAMVALRSTVARVAETDATVLVHGETGCGKELVAEAIHEASARADGPLVKVNCAALVETLLLSELFGHERGAFTGAGARRRGRFELAEGGTLFLDEIGDISPRTQVALLRVLQDGSFERVGGGVQLRSDVRVIVATHRDLRALVAEGRFREDLYYRLCGMVVEVPPLRERSEDLEALCESLLLRGQHDSGITARPVSRDALALLRRHSWPGNVRELQNALRAAAVFAVGEELVSADFVNNVDTLADLQRGARQTEGDVAASVPATGSSELVYAEIRSGVKLSDMKRRLEQQCIAQALIDTGGNITHAAELLGMKRPRLSQLVKKYELATVVEEAKS